MTRKISRVNRETGVKEQQQGGGKKVGKETRKK